MEQGARIYARVRVTDAATATCQFNPEHPPASQVLSTLQEVPFHYDSRLHINIQRVVTPVLAVTVDNAVMLIPVDPGDKQRRAAGGEL